MEPEYKCSSFAADYSPMEGSSRTSAEMLENLFSMINDRDPSFPLINDPFASRQGTQDPPHEPRPCDIGFPPRAPCEICSPSLFLPVVSEQPVKFTKFRYQSEVKETKATKNGGFMTKLKVNCVLKF